MSRNSCGPQHHSPADLSYPYESRRPHVKRLDPAWSQGSRGDAISVNEGGSLVSDAPKPKKRPRTLLRPQEVDAIRIAHTHGDKRQSHSEAVRCASWHHIGENSVNSQFKRVFLQAAETQAGCPLNLREHQQLLELHRPCTRSQGQSCRRTARLASPALVRSDPSPAVYKQR